MSISKKTTNREYWFEVISDIVFFIIAFICLVLFFGKK